MLQSARSDNLAAPCCCGVHNRAKNLLPYKVRLRKFAKLRNLFWRWWNEKDWFACVVGVREALVKQD